MEGGRDMLKSNAKEIKKRGRNYGKRAFGLNENDFISLEWIERAYLAGYKRAMEEVLKQKQENIRDNGIKVFKTIFD